MISPINGINNIYTNKLKKQSFKEALPVEEEKREVYADPSAAIKSQLGVKTPISYTFIRDIEMPYSEPAKLYKLANGQKVAILHKKGPAVVKSYYNVGALNEPEGEKGISHFIEHMKFNGSENLNSGEFFNTVNKIGASTNAGTGLSMTDYFVAGQMLGDNDLETTVRIHADMLQAPSHTPEMVEKEKGPVLSEISMCMDHPENLAMNNCIKNLFGIKTGVKDLVAGSANTVGNLSSEKVKAYDETWYTPDNCITVITGNVDPQKTIELVAKYLPKALANPEDLEARYFLAYAAMMGGVSFDNGLLHYTHALEHPLSAVKPDLSHGLGLAILLPAVVETIYKDRAATLADILAPIVPGLTGDPSEAKKAADGVYAWLKSVDVPEKLEDMGFKAEDVDKLTNLAFTTPSLDGLINIGPSGNSKETVRAIYEKSLKA